jgi:glutamine---fructose-6-phosphate transaminase (isomerizing)
MSIGGTTRPGVSDKRPGQLMASEMAEQPNRLAVLLSRREELSKEVRALVPPHPAGTVLVARGSSDHAAKCGAYLLEMSSGRPVALASPSIQTLCHSKTDYSGYLLIAVSQSGQTPEIVEVVHLARANGARAIAITNDSLSPLAGAADLVVTLEAGRELAVPATKTVTAELVAFAIIAQALGEIGLDDEVCEELPGQVARVIGDPGPASELARWLRDADRLVTVARGILYGAAREAGLKVSETTSLLTAAFSAADLRHGPIAVASSGTPVLAFAHPGPTSQDVVEVVSELRKRGASVRLAGPVEGSDVGWPASAPEILAPILAVVRGQQLALSLALELGRDPDSPPGLMKVTAT